MHVAVDLLSQLRPHARGATNYSDRGGLQPRNRTKVSEERLHSFRAQPRDLRERTRNRRAAPLTLERDRKAVRFVSHALHEE